MSGNLAKIGENPSEKDYLVYLNHCSLINGRYPKPTPNTWWKPWTKEQDELLMFLTRSGKTGNSIANRMRLTVSQCEDRVNHIFWVVTHKKVRFTGRGEIFVPLRFPKHKNYGPPTTVRVEDRKKVVGYLTTNPMRPILAQHDLTYEKVAPVAWTPDFDPKFPPVPPKVPVFVTYTDMWTKEQDSFLIRAMTFLREHGKEKALSGGEYWKFVASKVQGKNETQCEMRYFNDLDEKRLWRRIDNYILNGYVLKHGTNWKKISQYIYRRSEKQVEKAFFHLPPWERPLTFEQEEEEDDDEEPPLPPNMPSILPWKRKIEEHRERGDLEYLKKENMKPPLAPPPGLKEWISYPQLIPQTTTTINTLITQQNNNQAQKPPPITFDAPLRPRNSSLSHIQNKNPSIVTIKNVKPFPPINPVLFFTKGSAWTLEEDERLFSLTRQYENMPDTPDFWNRLSLSFIGRDYKVLRLRYICYHHPTKPCSLQWSKEELEKLSRLMLLKGSGRGFAEISNIYNSSSGVTRTPFEIMKKWSEYLISEDKLLGGSGDVMLKFPPPPPRPASHRKRKKKKKKKNNNFDDERSDDEDFIEDGNDVGVSEEEPDPNADYVPDPTGDYEDSGDFDLGEGFVDEDVDFDENDDDDDEYEEY